MKGKVKRKKEEDRQASLVTAPNPINTYDITTVEGTNQWRPTLCPFNGVYVHPFYGLYVHPFYGLYDEIEEVLIMQSVGKRRKTWAKHVGRILDLLPWFRRQIPQAGERLSPVAIRLKAAIESPNANELLEDARSIVGAIIWADENAKYPGCRNEDGWLVLPSSKGGVGG